MLVKVADKSQVNSNEVLLVIAKVQNDQGQHSKTLNPFVLT